MNKVFLVPLLFALSLATVCSQSAGLGAFKKLTPEEAKASVGKYATVVGKVVQVRAQEKVTHINFEKPYPYQTFTAVVFASKTNLFPKLDKLPGKTVEISGKIEEYSGKPQIVLQATTQLKLVVEKEPKKSDNEENTEKPDVAK